VTATSNRSWRCISNEVNESYSARNKSVALISKQAWGRSPPTLLCGVWLRNIFIRKQTLDYFRVPIFTCNLNGVIFIRCGISVRSSFTISMCPPAHAFHIVSSPFAAGSTHPSASNSLTISMCPLSRTQNCFNLLRRKVHPLIGSPLAHAWRSALLSFAAGSTRSSASSS
jgi:hypothetical protein